MNGELARDVLDALPWGVVVVDREGGVAAVNRAARDRFAVPDAPTGSTERPRLPALLPLDPPLAVESVLRSALEDGASASTIARPVRADADPPADRVCLHAFPLDAGAARGAVVLLEPLPPDEDRDRAVRRLERAVRDVGLVRHQVNNALMSIFGNAELLATRPETPPPAQDRARAILDDARRIRDLMQETKSIGRDDD